MQLFSEDPEEVLQDVQDPEETTRRMNILKTLLLLGLRFLGFVSFCSEDVVADCICEQSA